MDHRPAFKRAWKFLDYSSSAKWTAIWAAIGGAFSTLALFIILALFVDLLMLRGQIPAWHDLRTPLRQRFDADLRGLGREGREESLAAVGIAGDRLQQFDDELLPKTDVAREWLWRAWVWHVLKQHVGPPAAEFYAGTTDPTTALQGTDDAPPLGLLSLVVRRRGISQIIAGKAAHLAPWTWSPWHGDGPNYAYLVGLLILGVLCTFLRAGLLNLMNYAAATTTLDAATRLRRAVYYQSIRSSSMNLRSDGSTESTHVFTRHVEAVHEALETRLTTFIVQPLQLVLLVGLALVIDPGLAASFLLFVAIVVLVGGQMAVIFRDRARRADRRAANQLALLQESLQMTRLVKANRMERFNQTRVERQLGQFAAFQLRRSRSEALFHPLLVLLGTLSAIILLFVAGLSVLNEGVGLTSLILLAATLTAAYFPLQAIAQNRRTLRRGRDAAAVLFEFLDRHGEVGQILGAEFLPGIENQIEYRGVHLRDLNTGRFVLQDVSLTIGAQQRIAIVGPDEDAKHALVYLLVRFLDPTTGEVRIDEKEVRWLTLDSVRTQTAVVLQNSLVFNDSVANNIGCGDSSITLPQIVEAAKLAHAHQFIQKLQYGYETPIGDLGVALNPGQKFRIALARAILREPSLLVIEEPLTPFDDDTKGMIDDALARVLPGKTVIFLAHRISTIRSCDHVILMNRGQVEAAGEHRELLKTSDLYKHLHYMEFNEFAHSYAAAML